MGMSDKFDVAATAAAEVAKDVYKDGLQPTVQATGAVIGFIPRTVRVLLSPLEQWIIQSEHNRDMVSQMLEEKLKNTQPDKLVSPEAYIGVPALQNISYCMDNEQLREMYANLLASAMNSDKKSNVHPAFVDIIRHLSPDEAKLLKLIVAEEDIPIVTVRRVNKAGHGDDILSNFSTFGEDCGCENPLDIEKYFDNLERLGLIARLPYQYIVDANAYDRVESHPLVIEKMNLPAPKDSIYTNNELSKGVLTITAFGKGFCAICMEIENS